MKKGTTRTKEGFIPYPTCPGGVVRRGMHSNGASVGNSSSSGYEIPRNAWERAEATKLALCLQAMYRGVRSRKESRKRRILYLIRAISIIQRAYRSWRMRRFAHTPSYRIKSRSEVPTSSSLPWDTLQFGRGTYEDRVLLWRAVIELRRAHPHFCTDVCLRALVGVQMRRATQM